LLLTDSDSSSDSDLSEDDRKYRKKRKQKERRKRKEQKQRDRREKTRKDEKSPMRSPADPLEEKLREVQKMKEDLLDKKIEELRELASQSKIVPAGPVTPTTPTHPYTGPLGYGSHEHHGVQSNLIETGHQDRMATNPNIVCYNCEMPGHYESQCRKPRVAPEIRAENIQRINANSGRRRSYPPRYGQGGNEQRYGQGGNEQRYGQGRNEQRWEPYQPDTRMQQEVEFLRRQVMELQRGNQQQGSTAAGQGPTAAGQGLITAGQGPTAAGQGPTAVNMIETEDGGMLASALEGMEYEDAKDYADVLAWDGPDPNPVDKRKRATSDGEVVAHRPQPKRPTLKPVGSGRPGRAIPEEELAGRPPATIPADLLEKTKKKRRHPNDREPIRMMKGQPKFDTMATLRDTEVRGMTYGQLFLLAPSTRQEVSYGLVQERAPRKKKSKEQENVVSLVEPISSKGQSGKTGHALPEAVGRIVNFYTTAQVMQSEGQHSCTLKRALVDGGSVLNMMPLSLARRMDLTLKPQSEVVMKTAASTFHEIKYYVDLEVTVAGVTASIRCYCLPGTYSRSSYTLLLGRRWMKQVQALGD